MALAKIDIGAEFGRGWNLFKANMSLLIVASLLAMLLSLITCGILAGPLMVGVFLVIERLMRQDPVKPQAGDIFKGFDFFVQALLLMVIVLAIGFLAALIPVVGQLAGFLLNAVLIWGLMFVAYQKLTAIDALKKVWDYSKTGDFTMPLVLAVVAGLVASLGLLACLVGIFFTAPLSYCIMASCYQTLFAGDALPSDPNDLPPLVPCDAPSASADAPTADSDSDEAATLLTNVPLAEPGDDALPTDPGADVPLPPPADDMN